MYISLSTFVKRDIEILHDDFQIINYRFDTSKKWKLTVAFVKQFFFLLKNRQKNTVIVTQSAGYLSFLPAVFQLFTKIPLVIIAIGTDCIKMPEIQYGAHTKWPLSWFTNYSFKHAKLLVPVHKTLVYQEYRYFPIQFPKQGIKAFLPHLKTPVIEVVNGFDWEKWNIRDEGRVPLSFISVSTSLQKTGYFLKGIDLILAMAKRFPDYTFTIVGKVYVPEKVPQNVSFIPHVSPERLMQLFNQHQFYLQLSISEGFPNTLCESMLCGCIPIGSNVASIPEIIGDSGYILTQRDETELERIFQKLAETHLKPEDMRKRIVENFPLIKRKTELLQAIRSVI